MSKPFAGRPAPPSPLIRHMVSSDLPQVMRIQRACYEQAFHEPRDAFAVKLHGSEGTCWVACDGLHIYAYLVSLVIMGDEIPALHATTWQPGSSPTWLYLHDLAIDPQFRGSGLSAWLLDAAKAYAHAHQLTAIGLIAVQGSEPFWAQTWFCAALAQRQGLYRQAGLVWHRCGLHGV